jgi:hypothetical protein
MGAEQSPLHMPEQRHGLEAKSILLVTLVQMVTASERRPSIKINHPVKHRSRDHVGI